MTMFSAPGDHEFDIPLIGTFTPRDELGLHDTIRLDDLVRVKGVKAFTRDPYPGHVTASGIVVSPDRRQVLLMHHRKLDRWLQPGGHCDGETDTVMTARREVEEETGLTEIKLVSDRIFDVDIHTIPARKDDFEHEHFDVRYLFELDPEIHVPGNSESKAITWVSMENLHDLVDARLADVIGEARSW